MRTTGKYLTIGLFSGSLLGIIVGGLFLANIPIGLAMGAALGLACGVSFDQHQQWSE
jgi:uncharacterized membrane protein